MTLKTYIEQVRNYYENSDDEKHVETLLEIIKLFPTLKAASKFMYGFESEKIFYN